MTVDEKARQQLRDRQMIKQFQSGINDVADRITGENSNIKTIAKDLKDIQETMAGDALKKLDEISNKVQSNMGELDSKIKAFENIQKKVPQPIKVEFPKDISVKGKTNVGIVDKLPALDIKTLPRVKADIVNIPPVEISNFSELSKAMSVSINGLREDVVSLSKLINVPSKLDSNKPIRVDSWGDLLSGIKEVVDGIEELKKGFNLLINKEGQEYSSSNPMPVAITSYPPVMVPQPVTHISINSLGGFVKTTAATVTTGLTPLPTYGVLANRRSIIIYNNSSNTIYVGGSDVTTSNGMPVPANSYSPIIDAGVNMIFYGIASTGSNNVRVMEVSDEGSGR